MSARTFILLAARCPLLALMTACMSARTPSIAPSQVPNTVLDAMCARMHNEGLTGEVAVVKTTEPLVTRESMLALATAAFYHGKDDPARLADAAAAQVTKMPFTVAANGCELRAVDNASDARGDTMLLQISAPFVNPFVRGTAGLFARLSLGNEAAQWYWVPVSERNGGWYAGMPLPLGVSR